MADISDYKYGRSVKKVSILIKGSFQVSFINVFGRNKISDNSEGEITSIFCKSPEGN